MDITPDRPLRLGGYAARTLLSEGVKDRLEANILTLGRGETSVILVSLDLLYPGDRLRRIILDRTRLAPEQLFLCATHTHTAPMTQYGMPRLGVPHDEYVESIGERIAAAIEATQIKSTSARIIYTSGTADHSVNRRLRRLRVSPRGISFGEELGPNPSGKRDEAIRILKIVDGSDRVEAVVWNYACHPTSNPELLKVSGDFPAAVRTSLRARHGNIPVLFLQGFAGNVRPPFVAKVANIKTFIKHVLLGPQFGAPSMQVAAEWEQSLAQVVSAASTEPGITVDTEGISAARSTSRLPAVTKSGDGEGSLVLHTIRLGDIHIIGLNCEPVVELRKNVEEVFCSDILFTVGYIDQVFGYLPTDSMLKWGGYEVEGFRRMFEFKSKYVSGIEKELYVALLSLKKDLGA